MAGKRTVIEWSQIRASFLGEESRRELLPQVKLPVLPQAVSEFSRRADEPDCSVRELASIVEADGALTCHLLRNVNASAGGLKHRIMSVQHAIATLGIRRTKLNLIATAVQEALPVRQLKLIHFSTFWNTNLERACLARRIARLFKADEELAFAAALLADFLLPVLTNSLDRHYFRFLQRQPGQPGQLVQFEQQAFRWNHAEAGARVMFDWGFPDDLICCVLFHHHGLSLLRDPVLGRSAAAAVALAGLMPDSLHQCPDGIEQLALLGDMWKSFRLRLIALETYEDYEPMALDSSSYIPFRQNCERYLATREVVEADALHV